MSVTTERIPTRVDDYSSAVALRVAREIADLIRQRTAAGQRCVLALAQDSACLGVYDEVVRMHREEGLSFRSVVVFNVDEYYPIGSRELQSQARALREALLDHVDCDPELVHLLDADIPREAVDRYCREYEARIASYGGIDLALMGVGDAGHLGANEPGSGGETRTRVLSLDRRRRHAAASDFFGVENVPPSALGVGIATLMDARAVRLIVLGENKAELVRRTVEEPVDTALPSSFLQEHHDAALYLDASAAVRLTRNHTPWLCGPVAWDERTTMRAVIMLARKTGKAILKLTEEDYTDGGLQDLLAANGRAYGINLRVFRRLQATITGWPGGKPVEAREAGDRPGERDHLYPKRVIIFSPHPDDDVISMGGTLIRLVDQGHEVHIAYQTSGNIAVFDEDALRFSDFVAEFCEHFAVENQRIRDIDSHVDRFLRNKEVGQVDSPEVQQIKGLIRRSEARAAARCCGVVDDRLHFQDLPFYRTGRVRKAAISEDDILQTVDLLRDVQPHQVYVAGDLSDPHGTHRTCLSIVLQAMQRCAGDSWHRDCLVLLYRGAWQEWPVEQIDIAVPLSPQEVERKRNAIFKHESQKDRALFPGSDAREFWQRAEVRNAETARIYDALGLAEYEAMEGFVRWDGVSGITL